MCCFKVFICAHTTFATQLKIRTMACFHILNPQCCSYVIFQQCASFNNVNFDGSICVAGF